MADIYCYKAESIIHFLFEIDGKIHGAKYLISSNEMMDDWVSWKENDMDLKEYAEFRFKKAGNNNLDELKLIDGNPGTYYPRIYRPCFNQVSSKGHGEIEFIDRRALAESVVITKILLSKINKIFETIHPDTLNQNSYGHEIRNVLLLASMEVEASWNGILKANNYPIKRCTTNDYVKLLKPLYLADYGIKFISYTDFPLLKPFENWDSTSPTTSLFWYDNYNKTKHDREAFLNLANLHSCINSIAAVIALLHAQFGSNHNFWNEAEFLEIEIEFKPNYEFNEYYIPYKHSCDWQQINYPF